ASVPPASEPAGDETERTAGTGFGLGGRYGPVQATFQLFGDVGLSYEEPGRKDVHTSFAFGSVDAFVSGKIGEHFQALGELVFEGDSANNEVGSDFERLWGSWTFNDLLYLKLGREHSPTNRW